MPRPQRDSKETAPPNDPGHNAREEAPDWMTRRQERWIGRTRRSHHGLFTRDDSLSLKTESEGREFLLSNPHRRPGSIPGPPWQEGGGRRVRRVTSLRKTGQALGIRSPGRRNGRVRCGFEGRSKSSWAECPFLVLAQGLIAYVSGSMGTPVRLLNEMVQPHPVDVVGRSDRVNSRSRLEIITPHKGGGGRLL